MKKHEFSQFGAFPAGSSTPALNPAEGHVHELGHAPECPLRFSGEEGGNVFRTKVKTALKSSIIPPYPHNRRPMFLLPVFLLPGMNNL